MDKREAELLNAADEALPLLRSVAATYNNVRFTDRHGDGPLFAAAARKLEAALRNYVPPLTSEPGFDARDNSSLGMKEDFGMGEVK